MPMNKILLIFLSILCTKPVLANSQLRQQINNDIEEYQTLVEQAFSYREKTIQAYQAIKQELDNGIPLSGENIEILNNGMQQHLEMRHEFYQVIYFTNIFSTTQINT